MILLFCMQRRINRNILECKVQDQVKRSTA